MGNGLSLSILLLACALVLAGCLTPVGEDSATPQAGPDLPEEEPSPAPSPSENGSSNAEEGKPPPRTVEHARGQLTLEGSTERVVALEFNHVENLLALGIQPVGVADKDGFERWVDVGIPLHEDVVDVGTRAEPSLETISALEPDLILAIDFRHDDIYNALSRIAPTLLFEGFPDENASEDQFDRMVSIFERTGKATAHEQEAKEVLDAMDQTFETNRQRLQAEGMEGREILLNQLFTYNGQPLARVFIEGSIPHGVTERTGLENAWTRTACSTGYGYCDVSKEGFADVQHADFFYQAQEGDDPVEDDWANDPVWNSYEFVREDRVYPLGAKTWMFGGPLVSQGISERLVDHLAG